MKLHNFGEIKGRISEKLNEIKEKRTIQSGNDEVAQNAGKSKDNKNDEEKSIEKNGYEKKYEESYEPLSFVKPAYRSSSFRETEKKETGRSGGSATRDHARGLGNQRSSESSGSISNPRSARGGRKYADKSQMIYEEYEEPDYYSFYRKYSNSRYYDNDRESESGDGMYNSYDEDNYIARETDFSKSGGASRDGYASQSRGASHGGRYDSQGRGASQDGRYDSQGRGASQDGRYDSQARGASRDGRYDSQARGASRDGRYGSQSGGASRGGRYDSQGSGASRDGRYGSQSGGASRGGRYSSQSRGASRGDQYGTYGRNSKKGAINGFDKLRMRAAERRMDVRKTNSAGSSASSRRKVKIIAAVLLILMLFIAIKSASGAIKQNIAAKNERESYIAEARKIAMSYDYEGAIAKLEDIKDYSKHDDVTDLIRQYAVLQASLVPFTAKDVTHVFYHSLVVDPELAFNGQDSNGFKQWMTTVTEFNDITQEMYENGYILVNVHDFVQETVDSSGEKHFKEKEVYLPSDKKPYVLSLDDLSYYHTYDNKGIASKLVLDKNGDVTCEYIEKDGSVVTGAYDCVPLLNQFLEEHPDAAYKGARGIIALTGYNGIFGYRTDESYETREDIDSDKQEWLDAHPDFNLETEREEAKKIAKALKKEGWTFASHTWGHQKIGNISLSSLEEDTEKWMKNVEPLIGETDTIIFAHGSDLASGVETYPDSDKFKYLKEQGFNYYMNVYSKETYTMKICDTFVHQGRINLDGYRLWQDAYGDKNYLSKIVNAADVIDPVRKDMPAL